MNIVHILEDFSFLSGGLRTVVKNLHTRLLNDHYNSVIVTTRCENDDNVIKVTGGNKPWRYSNNLRKTLEGLNTKNKIDVIHIHGVWMYPQYCAAKFANRKSIPFLITPHGMYEPWLWKKGTFKKKLYFNLLAKPKFLKADFFQVITEDEGVQIRKLFPNSKIIEIPNLIDAFETPNQYYDEGKERYILFLGRLDKKKGIDLLIKAFAKLNTKDLKLKIAGGINEYKIELDQLVHSLGLEGKVEFLGLIKGKHKMEMFQNALVFVAPSHSEVVGMVNLEAAILKTPVITTFQTGLNKEWANNGGILINPNVNEIENALNRVLNWTNEERNNNGQKLHEFVLNEYSWQNKFKDWTNLYNTLGQKNTTKA